LILVVGATGSGKTTTLYAALETVRSPELSILTVEDPVERDIDDVSQIPVDEDAGRSFAIVLRAVLRQDPDVLMIGEIRDPETARVACRAALTGHLVLSTLHTADTDESLIRLSEMGVPAYLVGATICLVLAQRLLRRLCRECGGARTPSEAESALYRSRGLSIPRTVGEARGCERCGAGGFAGRFGVFELRECFQTDRTPASPRRRLIDAGLEQAALGRTTTREVLARCPDPTAKRAPSQGTP
jgi:type II secretory ATPase GspE/PulE/Tfp pilus assembly ATPase PilB-like protein